MLERFFEWVYKDIQDHFGFTQPCSVIGPENSHHPLNQSDAKLKTIATWSPAFSRALSSLLVFTLSSHWPMITWTFVLIGRSDYFGFSCWSLNWKLLYGAGGGGAEGGWLKSNIINLLTCSFLICHLPGLCLFPILNFLFIDLWFSFMPGEEENRNFYFEVHRRKVSFTLLFFTKKLQFFLLYRRNLRGRY